MLKNAELQKASVIERASWARSGELWMVGCVLGYVASHLFDKVAVTHVDPLIGPLFRRLPSLLLGLTLVLAQGTVEQIKPSSERFIGRSAILIFLAAGILQTIGAFAYYFALFYGGVVVTVPVAQTLVLWGAAVGWIYLGEKFNRKAMLGIVGVFVGLALLSYGQTQDAAVSPQWYYAIPLALISAVTWGIAGVLWRDGQLRGAHQSIAIFLQFGFAISLTVLVLVVMGRLGSIEAASIQDLGALLISGVLSGVVGVYCMFVALRLMSVARVYTFHSLVPLLAAFLAYALLGEYLNGLMSAGILSTCVGVVLVQVFKPPQERQA